VNIDQEAANIIKGVLLETQGDRKQHIADRKRALTERRSSLEAKIAKAEDALFSGTIDETRFKSALGRYQGELDGLTEEEARVRDDDRDFIALGVHLLELIKDVETSFLTKSAYEQVELLQILCSNIATDGVNIGATYRKPFDVLVEGLENENWLPGLDSNQQPCGYKCPSVSKGLGLSHHPF